MNAEQKKRMAHDLGQWNAAMKSSCIVSDLLAISTRMAALLQELIDAPAPEPVGYTNETELDYVRTYGALPVSGVFWPTCDEDADIALYTAPPAPSVLDAALVREAAPDIWRIMCGDWREETVAIHNSEGWIADGLDLKKAAALVKAHNGSLGMGVAAIERDKMKGGA